jgi:hypothetical protein
VEGNDISKMLIRHIWMLVFRLLVLAAVAWIYIMDSSWLDFGRMPEQFAHRLPLLIIWAVLACSMLLRLFPSKKVAMGARKFVGNSPAVMPKDNKNLHRGVIGVIIAWVVFNGAVFFVLHLLNLLTPASVIVLALTYAVCDLICILFFCPFQVFFMRNSCCTTCRIYNWDYLMMCTPFLLFPNVYSISLLMLAVLVLVRWELAVYKKPQLFLVETNPDLSCEKCTDKLCVFDNRKKAAKGK